MMSPGLVILTRHQFIKIHIGEKYFFWKYIVFCTFKMLNKFQIIVLKNKSAKRLEMCNSGCLTSDIVRFQNWQNLRSRIVKDLSILRACFFIPGKVDVVEH